MSEPQPTLLPAWCAVETHVLLAHHPAAKPRASWYFGYVTPETVAGQPFLRVDVPAHAGEEGSTVYLAASAVARIEPRTEQEVHQGLKAWRR